MEANMSKEGCMVGWKQRKVKKGHILVEANWGKEGCMVSWKQTSSTEGCIAGWKETQARKCMIGKTIRNSEGCMVGWNLIKGPVGKKAAMLDGRE